MNKLNQNQYEEYWKKTHQINKEPLSIVCFPNKPLYFNLFFDRIQKYIIRKYIKTEKIHLEDKRLLDIGCGRGRWLHFFEQYGAKVVGVDLSLEAVNECKKKGFEAFEADISNLNKIEKGAFDVVTSITVLLHLPYDVKSKAISEVARVVKEGGKVILIENTWNDPSPHVFSQTLEQWEDEFQQNDMKLIHHSGHCFNFFRQKLPCHIAIIERVAIYLDYISDFIMMKCTYGKESKKALQHFIVFEKRSEKNEDLK